MQSRARLARHREDTIEAHLKQLSPLSVLARGYAIVEDAQRHILRAATETAPGEPVRIRLHQGQLSAIVSTVSEPG